MSETKKEADVIAPQEQVMGQEISRIEQAAYTVVIASDADYEKAGVLLTGIKAQQKTVKEFFEPLRKTTKAAYDSVLSRRKDMTDPLDKAEKAIKAKMGAYQQEVERRRREQEERLRKAAEAERERAFAAAVTAEASGDALGAEMAMMDAEVMDDAASVVTVHTVAPKAKGISTCTGYEITGIDPDKVPVSIAGMVIRPVDEKAVMALIKASKGNIQIPGITYRETTIISARST